MNISINKQLNESYNIAKEERKQKIIEIAQLRTQIENMKGKIRVLVRIKQSSEYNNKYLEFADKQIIINRHKETYNSSFDKIFSPNDNQEDVFNELSALVNQLIEGENICILAYGATGTGKTYSLFGEEDEKKGLIPRSIKHLYDLINDHDEEFKVRIRVTEIYLNKARNLTISTTGQDQDENDFSDNLSFDNLMNQIKLAADKRVSRSTSCNLYSSRSHLLLELLLQNEQKNTVSYLTFVDLAGSEKFDISLKSDDKKLKETLSINKRYSLIWPVSRVCMMLSLLSKTKIVMFLIEILHLLRNLNLLLKKCLGLCFC